MELPEYGNTDAIVAALNQNRETLRKGKELIKQHIATKRAIQAMCKHDMVSDGDPRMPSSSCKHCGYMPNGHMQITIYE